MANDDPGCSYLIVANVGAGICGVLSPSLVLSAPDEKEALGLAGELLAMLSKPSAFIAAAASPSDSLAPANSNSASPKVRADLLRAAPQIELATNFKDGR